MERAPEGALSLSVCGEYREYLFFYPLVQFSYYCEGVAFALVAEYRSGGV